MLQEMVLLGHFDVGKHGRIQSGIGLLRSLMLWVVLFLGISESHEKLGFVQYRGLPLTYGCSSSHDATVKLGQKFRLVRGEEQAASERVQ